MSLFNLFKTSPISKVPRHVVDNIFKYYCKQIDLLDIVYYVGLSQDGSCAGLS